MMKSSMTHIRIYMQGDALMKGSAYKGITGVQKEWGEDDNEDEAANMNHQQWGKSESCLCYKGRLAVNSRNSSQHQDITIGSAYTILSEKLKQSKQVICSADKKCLCQSCFRQQQSFCKTVVLKTEQRWLNQYALEHKVQWKQWLPRGRNGTLKVRDRVKGKGHGHNILGCSGVLPFGLLGRPKKNNSCLLTFWVISECLPKA